MGNDDSGEVAAVTALVGVHIDAQERRACAFPAEIGARAKQHLAPPAAT